MTGYLPVGGGGGGSSSVSTVSAIAEDMFFFLNFGSRYLDARKPQQTL